MNSGSKLKRIMNKRSISNAELSRMTGMSCSHVSRILDAAHMCNMVTLYRLADALEISVAAIMPDRSAVLA